jgi:hypothetical protein
VISNVLLVPPDSVTTVIRSPGALLLIRTIAVTASLTFKPLMPLTIVPTVNPAFSAALSGVMLLILSPGPVKVGSNETPRNGLVDLPVAICSSAIRFA